MATPAAAETEPEEEPEEEVDDGSAAREAEEREREIQRAEAQRIERERVEQERRDKEQERKEKERKKLEAQKRAKAAADAAEAERQKRAAARVESPAPYVDSWDRFVGVANRPTPVDNHLSPRNPQRMAGHQVPVVFLLTMVVSYWLP